MVGFLSRKSGGANRAVSFHSYNIIAFFVEKCNSTKEEIFVWKILAAQNCKKIPHSILCGIYINKCSLKTEEKE